MTVFIDNMNKINYQLELDKIIEEITKNEKFPFFDIRKIFIKHNKVFCIG